MQTDSLQKFLEEAMTDCQVFVAGDGYHHEVVVVGNRFAGLSAVKKQQEVYRYLNDLLADGTVHAVSIKTYTPEEWQARS
jgi:acid stress-induced BolA-like protein IbaG/YrbA